MTMSVTLRLSNVKMIEFYLQVVETSLFLDRDLECLIMPSLAALQGGMIGQVP